VLIGPGVSLLISVLVGPVLISPDIICSVPELVGPVISWLVPVLIGPDFI